jgi:hypothetical protein
MNFCAKVVMPMVSFLSGGNLPRFGEVDVPEVRADTTLAIERKSLLRWLAAMSNQILLRGIFLSGGRPRAEVAPVERGQETSS